MLNQQQPGLTEEVWPDISEQRKTSLERLQHTVSESLQSRQRLLEPHEEVWERADGGTRQTLNTLLRVIQVFTTEQTSPAGRTSLGQVGHIRKCVFVIGADMRIRGKASSLPCRPFSLSRAALLPKPRQDKQCRWAC